MSGRAFSSEVEIFDDVALKPRWSCCNLMVNGGLWPLIAAGA